MFVVCFGCFVEYYLANWQTYVSGWYYFGTIDCTEGEMGTVSVLALTSIFGSSIWEYNVSSCAYLNSQRWLKLINLVVLKIPIVNIETKYIPVTLYLIYLFISISSNVVAISKGGCGKDGSSIAVSLYLFSLVLHNACIQRKSILWLFKALIYYGNFLDILKTVNLEKTLDLGHTFTPQKSWVWVLGMGFIPTSKTHTQNPNNLSMKPKTKNPTFFGMKPKPKPK